MYLMEKHHFFRDKFPIIIMILSAGILLFAAYELIGYYGKFRGEAELDARLQGIRDKIIAEEPSAEQPDMPEEQQNKAQHVMSELAAINPDYIGWITLQDTALSYPVVQRIQDNDYYLDHDFEGKENSHGAIFLDGGCDVEFPVWLIHGHHMKDKTMFGSLKYLEKTDYLQEHTTLYFDGGDGDEEYQIYAAALIDFSKENESFRSFHYEEIPVTTESFLEWQNNLKRYSYWYDTQYEERLKEISSGLESREVLVLSTCEYGTSLQRLIVAAIRIPEE